MSYLAWLVPLALGMGVAGLAAFLWSMRSGQYEDLDGAAERVLLADAADVPLREERAEGRSSPGVGPDRRNALYADGVHTKNKAERIQR